MLMKTVLNKFKLDFKDSDLIKSMSERMNILSWAFGGINYLGFNITGLNKVVIVITGWTLCQYWSLLLLKLSRQLSCNKSNKEL